MTKNATIIYVDDDADDQDILKAAFEEHHYSSVTYFSDAPSVLSFLKSVEDDTLLPKLIITDINMPAMSGLELLKKLKSEARFQHIKVIVFSTTIRKEYQMECKKLGAADIIQKPSSFSDLKELAINFLYQ